MSLFAFIDLTAMEFWLLKSLPTLPVYVLSHLSILF